MVVITTANNDLHHRQQQLSSSTTTTKRHFSYSTLSPAKTYTMTSPSSSSSSPPSGEDWQNHLTVLDSNRFMLENQIDCDVSFVLLPPGGESVNIGAHRYPLICRSPVFFAMFSGPLANNNGEKDIRITDIAPVTFWQLLRYIYYEDVDLSEDNVFPVLYAAKKYLVTSLSRKCIDFLSSILSPENACAFVENSFLFEEDDTSLRKNCLDVIRRHSRRVFHSETFYQASRETLCQVLRMDRLNVHEVDVFRAAVHWSERRSSEQNLSPTPNNKRNVLGEALFLIHVPAMSFSEFTKIVLPTRLLTSDEENSVFRLMLDRETAAHAQSVPFPQNCRSFVATRCDVVYTGFVRHVSQLASMFQGTPQRSRWSMTFYCDHSIKVQEIGVFGLMKGQLTITQNGFRKLEISTPTPVQTYQVAEDDVQLDPGPFTISADQPFAYTGEYFSKGMSSSLPLINSDNDRVNVSVRESSCLCFLSHVIFSPTDELHFIDNYYNEDSENSSFDG